MAAPDYYRRYVELAQQRGGELLSPAYLGCRLKHRWKCAEGHVWEATPGNIGRSWCPTCGWKQSGKKRRGENLRRGREVAAAAGGKCLSEEDGGMSSTARWECAKGHVWRASYGNVIHHKTWCPQCSAEENGARKIADNLSAAQRLAASRGGECLETANFSIHDSVRWKCASGHEWAAVYYSVRRGKWCQKCAHEGAKVPRVDSIGRARMIAAQRGGLCLEDGNFKVSVPVRWQCRKGHRWEAKWTNVAAGTWCPRCLNKSEQYCSDVLEALFPGYEFERNVRNLPWLGTGLLGRPLELDVWCPELALALEFNGFLHDAPVAAYGGEAHYARIAAHDRAKEVACFTNEVCLIVVRFSEVSINQKQIDPQLAAKTIWDAVLEMRYPAGTHLSTFEDLLAALDVNED